MGHLDLRLDFVAVAAAVVAFLLFVFPKFSLVELVAFGCNFRPLCIWRRIL